MKAFDPSHRFRASRNRSSSSEAVGQTTLASPGLIAECHVLHRLLLPRHPPNALLALDPIQKKTGPLVLRRFTAANPSPWRLVRKSFDPRSPGSRQGKRRQRHRRSRCRDQGHLSVSVFLTWKDCPCSPPPWHGQGRSPARAPRRTRLPPTRDRHKNVSCFALCTMSKAGCRHPGRSHFVWISRSDSAGRPRTSWAIRSRQSGPVHHRARPGRTWWSLPGSNR